RLRSHHLRSEDASRRRHGLLPRARTRAAGCRAPHPVRHGRRRGDGGGAVPRGNRMPMAREAVQAPRPASNLDGNPRLSPPRDYRAAASCVVSRITRRRSAAAFTGALYGRTTAGTSVRATALSRAIFTRLIVCWNERIAGRRAFAASSIEQSAPSALR